MLCRRLVSLYATLSVLLAACGNVSVQVVKKPSSSHWFVQALDPDRFYAKRTVQNLAPDAFALMPAGLEAVRAIKQTSRGPRSRLVVALRSDSAVASGITRFPSLDWTTKVAVIRQAVAIEAAVLGFTLPPVTIDDGPSRRAAYFDFDPAQPGTGRVLLYADVLKQETNPYASLLLALHEVRHSGQFQLAFGPPAKDKQQRTLQTGFAAAFKAQKTLGDKLGFCDFCSLLNEYEAFQCANEVVGHLTGWQVDTVDMGCYSSQFDAKGLLRIDLDGLSRKVGANQVLDAFNRLEKEQFEALQ
jgi:hypothetical protein